MSSLKIQVRRPFRPLVVPATRFGVAVAHRRAGKTVAAVQRLILSALACELPSPRCSYIAPTYRQAKDVAWEYLKSLAGPVLAGDPHETELRVTLVNGARIRLYGAENGDALRGVYHDDVALDEYADMPPSVWPMVVRPALSDRNGKALFIGTPKGRNTFFDIYDDAGRDPEWTRLTLRASETGLLPASELDAARRDMTPEVYAQEYECSFEAAILGAYYGRELADLERMGRLVSVPREPALPVHTAWDLGIGDSTAIWAFQVLGGEIRVIGHYEASGRALDHYAKECEARGWKGGEDFVPHDARVRELGTGRTRVEMLLQSGRRPRLVPAHRVEDGINAARMTLPLCWFDADACRDGLEALRQYRTDYDEKTRAFRNTPKHDWTSHSADAFRYLAMAWRELAPAAPKAAPRFAVVGGESTITITIEDLWMAQAEKRRERI